MQSVIKQAKYKISFAWKIKRYTQRVKFTMEFAKVEKITLTKQKETLYQGGQNMILPLKILNQQGT